MVRRSAMLLWRTVDAMIANRELRLETELSDWDVVDEWVRHYQTATRKKMPSPAPRSSQRKTNKRENKLLKSSSQQRITHKSVPESSQSHVKPPFLLQLRLNSKDSYKNRDKSEQRTKSPGAWWRRPPLPRSQSHRTSDNSDQFMDREYMQLMQQRLLEQHEETLKRRIRQRQAEEAQRERQLMLAGLVPTPTSHVVVPHTPKRGVHSQPNSRASHSSRSTYARAPRPRAHGRPRPASSPRFRDRAPIHKKANHDIDLPASTPSDEDDDLDEAAESLPPPPPRPRPRLAILLQACRAVVGAPPQPDAENNLSMPTTRTQLPEEEVGSISLRGIKYESPLIAKLREVENVEELYRLAELIVAHTKHP